MPVRRSCGIQNTSYVPQIGSYGMKRASSVPLLATCGVQAPLCVPLLATCGTHNRIFHIKKPNTSFGVGFCLIIDSQISLVHFHNFQQYRCRSAALRIGRHGRVVVQLDTGQNVRGHLGRGLPLNSL